MLTEKEQKVERKSKRYRFFDICFAVGIAFILHVTLGVFLANHEWKIKPQAPVKQKPFHVRLVSKNSFKKKSEPIPEKQLVSMVKPLKNERPKEADYLSEYDQKVQEQTKSFQSSPNLSQHETQASEDIKKIGSNVLVPEQRADAPRQNSKIKKEAVWKQPVLSSGQQALMGKSLDESTGGKDLINLMPSVHELEHYNGSAFNDHLEDVEEDAKTRLNTFQWKHATYFNRIKETVSHVWSPDRQIQRYDPQGTMFGQRDRYTIVIVTLDRQGVVVDVNVRTESGVDYLDQEAVRTFKVAASFPNPPLAVFGDGNTFDFAFGFHVSYEKGFFGDFGW